MKSLIAYLFFFFFLAGFVQAQVKFFRVKKLNADSLVALLPEKEDTELIEVLNLLSNVICRENIDSSINLAYKAIDLSEKLAYQKGLADGYFNVGNVYFLLDSLQPTITNYLKAQRIYEDIDPTEEYANLLMQLGVVNYFTGRIEVSRPYNRQAKRIYESLGDKEGLFNASFGMGIYYHVHRPFYLDSVIHYCLNAKSFFDTLTDQDKLAYLYAEIGEACQVKFRETLDTSYLYDALSWNYKGQALPKINEDSKSRLYAVAMDIYDAFNTEQGLDSCKAILKRVRDLCDTCKYISDNKTNISMWLGWISYREGDYDNAIKFFKQCIGFADAKLSNFSVNDFNEPINGYNSKFYLKSHKRFIYSYLYKIYNELGHFEQALENYILWRQVAEEIYMDGNQNLITWMGSVSENEKTAKQIALLARDNELNKTKVAQSRTYMIAMGGFVIILVLVTILIIRQRRTRLIIREQKLLHDLEIKEVESKKLKELDKMKSRFFANISHEFRTPLTLIMRPIKKVLSKIEDPQHKKDLDVAKKYAGKLQSLINNLLAISKLESGKMQLHTSETDVVKLTRNFTNAFESLAKQNNITFNFKSESKEIKAFIDREKFEQLLNNLLSNAFKFTGEGGVVEVEVGSQQSAVGKKSGHLASDCELQTVDSEGSYVEIKISDTGRGIAHEHINHIFDRFYQVEQENNNYFEGTGIGLALTKELVELHHGKIEVISELNKGSTFTIYLPLGKDHLRPEEIEVDKSDKIATTEHSHQSTITQEVALINNETNENNNNQAILLIVEDNADMRTYIREHFESEYQIIEAVDGLDGYKKSTEHIPDVIISDLMMPNMDGNEFCRKVKSDERTSHIPVVLLTAKASSESKIEGLETGADDYITKPFDGKELQVRVKNLVQQRKRTRELLERKIRSSQSIIHINFADSGITSMDEQFMQKVVKVLKEHHTNPDLNIVEFGQHIGLSIAQLNRKMKALTDQSTAEFIRTFRLTRAAELIKKKSGTIAEIAYDVGFSSPSYFTECFKTHFGILPSEFNRNT